MQIKRFISFCLIGLILAVMVQPSLKILHFYKNQAEIIAQHCVNKNKPELNCQGHCYLKKELKADKSIPSSDAIPEINVFLPMADCSPVTIEIKQLFYLKEKKYHHILPQKVSTYIGEIFTPPKSLL